MNKIKLKEKFNRELLVKIKDPHIAGLLFCVV